VLKELDAENGRLRTTLDRLSKAVITLSTFRDGKTLFEGHSVQDAEYHAA
jgi:hypothetical protein